jgi:hypothetical protein
LFGLLTETGSREQAKRQKQNEASGQTSFTAEAQSPQRRRRGKNSAKALRSLRLCGEEENSQLCKLFYFSPLQP